MRFGQPKANLRYCAKCGKVLFCFDLHGSITLERYKGNQTKIYLLSLRWICKLFMKFGQSKFEISSDKNGMSSIYTKIKKNSATAKVKIVKI